MSLFKFKQVVLYTLLFSLGYKSVAQTVDSNFIPIIKGIPKITEVVAQLDGKVLIAGDFIVIDGVLVNGLARLNSDGTLDQSFELNALPKGSIFDIYLSNTGDKIYIGGAFKDNDDIYRLNMDGTIDPSFNINVDLTYVIQIDEQSDGKLILLSSSQPNKSVIRIDKDGNLDDTFLSGSGPSGMSVATNDLEILLDDKILITGKFSEFDGIAANNIVRLTKNGEVDNSFNIGSGLPTSGYPSLNSINELPDGKIILTGKFSSYNDTPTNGIVKLNSDGSIDPSFILLGPATFFEKSIISQIDGNGKIILSGLTNDLEYSTIRLNSDGSNDASFNLGYSPIPRGVGQILNPIISIDVNNNVYLGGVHSHYNGVRQDGLTKLNLDGTVTTNYYAQIGGAGTVNVAVRLTNGKFIIGGSFIGVGNDVANNLALLNPDGSLDTNFQSNIGAGPDLSVNSILEDNNGDFIIGGSFLSFDSNSSFSALAKVSSSGILDNTFTPSVQIKYVGLGVHALKLDQNGKILIGGLFDYIGGANLFSLARLNTDGSLDMAFNPANTLPIESFINSIELQSDGKIIIGGYHFATSVNTGGILKRFNVSGSEDLTFSSSYDLSELKITALTILTNNSIIAGSRKKSSTVQPLLQFNSEGVIEDDISVSFDYNVNKLIALDNDNLLIGGNFTNVNGIKVSGLAKISLEGDFDTSYNYTFELPVKYGVASIQGMLLIDETMLLINGNFTKIENTQVFNIGIINLLSPKTPSSLSTSFNFETGVSVNWSDDSNNETGFELYRSTNELDYTLISTLGSDETNFTDETIELAKTYWYKIRAINSSNFSDFSNTSEQVIEDLINVSDIAASFDFMKGVLINWSDNSEIEEYIDLYKSSDNTNFDLLASLNANSINYEDIDVSLNKEYHYKAKLRKGIFSSNFSETLSYITPQSAFLEQPTKLTLISKNKMIELNWNDNNTTPVAFEIFKSVENEADFNLLFKLEATNYSDGDIEYAKNYFYKVRTINSFENSDFSEVQSLIITAIDSNSKTSKIEIYPNPSNNVLNVKLELGQIIKYQIIDFSGAEVLNKIVSSSEPDLSINLNLLKQGLYSIIIQTKTNKTSHQFLIKR